MSATPTSNKIGPDSLQKLTTRPSLNSLTSSRPAPPSPSTSSSGRSRPPSGSTLSQSSPRSSNVPAATSTAKRQSRLQNEIHIPTLESPPPPQSPIATALATIESSTLNHLRVKIRDFGFASTDDRHVGNGPDAPKANKRPGSGLLEDEEEFGLEKMAGWGAAAGLIPSLGGGRDSGSRKDTPSVTDLAMNFDVSTPADEKSEFMAEDDEDEYEDDYDDGPLLPGRYRAAYAFDPEGTTEMALKEGQEVDVIGRGGGVGWAVVEKSDGGHALVPESYLELIALKE